MNNMFIEYLKNFNLDDNTNTLFQFDNVEKVKTTIKTKKIEDFEVLYYVNEFWTSKQRQANSIHEVSYRACFKPQLPHFFIKKLTREKDFVYDPFLGRGTTIIEAALMNRQVIGNDINPLSKILAEPRLLTPDFYKLQEYLVNIPFKTGLKADIDLLV